MKILFYKNKIPEETKEDGSRAQLEKSAFSQRRNSSSIVMGGKAEEDGHRYRQIYEFIDRKMENPHLIASVFSVK